MMIVKEGNPDWNKNPKRFECIYCGCVFIASDSEYIISDLSYMTYYQCNCPCCDNKVSHTE